MLRRRFLFVASAVACGLLAGNLADSVAHAGGVTPTLINLVPAPGLGNLKGKAKSKVAPREAEFSVEVENYRVPAGTQVTVYVAASPVGTITIDAFRKGKLKLNSKLGHSVPVITPGTKVEVKNGNLEVILSGSF